uniref:Uncharacterized protein n=1 Tax=Anguilla anguilla TaxID=7936 RepID=A0A0E9Q768_ANGAN
MSCTVMQPDWRMRLIQMRTTKNSYLKTSAPVFLCCKRLHHPRARALFGFLRPCF